MDAISLIYQIPLIFFKCVVYGLLEILRRDPERPLRRRLVVTLLRAFCHTLTFSQAKKLESPTGVGVRKFCKSEELPHSFIEIPVYPPSGSGLENSQIPPAILHVVDLISDKKGELDAGTTSFLYFYGSGYTTYVSPMGQLPMALEMARAAGARYLLVFEYGLAPETPYPGQLMQAIATLSLLCAKTPSEITREHVAEGKAARAILYSRKRALADDLIIAGDSAGGHLALSLLAHVRYPSPYGPPITLPNPLKGLILHSAWVTMSYTAPSYTWNARNDFLTQPQMVYFDSVFQPRRNEVWADPLRAAPSHSFWSSILQGHERLVERTLITAGTDEIFLDDITAMADLAGADGKTSRVAYVRCRGEAHVGYVIDLVAGHKDGDMRIISLKFCEGLKARSRPT